MQGRSSWFRALFVPAAVLACAAHAPVAAAGAGAIDPEPVTEPATAAPPAGAPDQPAEATGDETPLRCVPFATCGCFQEPECVAGRVRDDGSTFDIVGGPRDGETGHLSRDCPDGDSDPAACADYVDPAMICRRLQPTEVRSVKYLCSTAHAHVGWECGFVDGACAVL